MKKCWFGLSRRLRAAKDKSFHRGSNDSTTSVATFALSEGRPKRILVFGDSNAFRPDGANSRWTALLEDKAPVYLNVFNESYDGRTTRFDTGERNGLGAIGNKLASHTPLDYVIVMLGTNDVKSLYGPPSAADIAAGLGKILDLIDAQGTGAEPILMTPPPLGNITSGDLAGAASRISRVAVAYRLLAMNRHIRLIDIHAILDSRTDLESDNIHLNARGRQKVAGAVWVNLRDVTEPPQVTGVSGISNDTNFKLTWKATTVGTFYYRVRRNGNVIGRTMNTSFEVPTPAMGDSFTVEAVDFSQNTGKFSKTVIYNDGGGGGGDTLFPRFKHLTLPAQMYTSKCAQHFHSEEEINEFEAEWRRNIALQECTAGDTLP